MTQAAARLAELGERYFRTQHTYDPYNATLLGITDFDGLAGDPSRTASEAAAAAFAALDAEIAAIDAGELDDAGRVDLGVLTVLSRGAGRDAHHALWAANASAKGYVSRQGLVFQAVPAMTITDADSAARYESRLGGLGAFFTALAQRYAEEADAGRVSTRLGIQHAIGQLTGHLERDLDDDALLAPRCASAPGRPSASRCARR
jgi:uncharacterized protein (DUF885 family)